MGARGTLAGAIALDEVVEAPPAPVYTRPGAPALSIRDVSKRWGGAVVLDGAAMEIQPGERVLIGGRNGAGKTTLLRIAAGLILPDAGKVELNGLRPDHDRRAFQRRLGFLSAGNTALYARLSVKDNLSFWAGIAFVPRRRRQQAVGEAIASFGLGDLADHRVDRLSMGQRQRVRLAGTFLHGPSVVLMDEPETSLDDDGLALLAETLADHVARGGSAAICSPTRERLGIRVDSAYLIESGRVLPA